MRKILISILAAMPVMAFAHGYTVGDLVVIHPMALETAVTAQSGAGYLSIANNGTTDDRLISVEADFPRVMLHETVMNGDVATMSHLDGVTIPAGQTVMLEPGGMHVMFMGLAGDPFEVGEEFNATLVFENAGTVEVVFIVEERSAGGAEIDHSNHD